jgi:(1->4)-alpha-D-glucan 1-alpha-D-glucosylmutase
VEQTPDLTASYRIQLTPSFGFADVVGLFDHLLALGVSHLYLSPIAEAVPGSLHGYDVIDHTHVRAEFGGEDGLMALLDAAFDHGLGVVIDHVPNHMSVNDAHLNARWWELLRDGPSSQAADWFDVDWGAGDGRVIVPKLGDPLEVVVARGDLSIGEGDQGPELRYGPLRFPLAKGTEQLDVAEAVDRQHYRLQWWREPARNVRRFFTIDDLVAVRAEQLAVAEVIDTIPTRLAPHPAFAGVRVDHVDGLAHPEAYLHGLRDRIGPHRWLLVEKILAVDESLPASWPVDGTTGYEHIRVTEHALLDPSAEQPLTELWHDLTGDVRGFEQIEDEGRREAIAGGLRPDLDRVVGTITAFGDADVDRLRAAIVELTIGVHRYRTYLPDDAASVAELQAAFERASIRRPDLADELIVLVDEIRRRPAIATRWEQLCSPAMAKGAEDRAFYRYLRLASLCEVGGAPGQWSLTADDFHRHQADVQQHAPLAMLAGTTHDTKRSEGVRARSLALAEIADHWAATVRSWFGAHRQLIEGVDAATVLLALQTAVTAWPIDADRLTEYLIKSAREADLHTSWIDVDGAYESALARLATVLTRELSGESADDGSDVDGERALRDIIERTRRPGWALSLVALAIRLTSPGVADLYQGTVAFTYSLVDPDNRVEPDWEERRALVETGRQLDGPSSWGRDDVEASKAVVITRILALRRRRPAAFGTSAGYVPLNISGPQPTGALAFARTADDRPVVVTIVGIRSVGAKDWEDTTIVLPEGNWHDRLADDSEVIAGGTHVPLATWLGRFPVAVLERTDG